MFSYQNGEAHCEDLPLSQIADEVGTPAYVYSMSVIRERCRRFLAAFKAYPTLPCYAVKANSNLQLLTEIFKEGFGADIVSIGELERALLSGAHPEKIVFSGVGKRDEEIERAIEVGILCLNVESLSELEQIERIATKRKKRARVSLRVNPNIDAKTNPYIATGLYSTKFGIAEKEVPDAFVACRGLKQVDLAGLSCHLGSQITTLKPFSDAVRRMVKLTERAQEMGFLVEHIDMGGGLGIPYTKVKPPPLEAYAKAILKTIRPTGLKLMLEPGRTIVAEAGILLSRVIHLKKTPKKNFVVVDAAMSELIRPALYEGHHEILPVIEGPSKLVADVVGPICETGDYLGLKRKLPLLKTGDLVFIANCGAYGMSMASHYNSRPNAPEILVDGKKLKIIRRRERLDALWSLELS